MTEITHWHGAMYITPWREAGNGQKMPERYSLNNKPNASVEIGS